MNNDLTKGVPQDAIFSTSPKSFINPEILYNWFVKLVGRISTRHKVPHLLDGHASHLSRETSLLARESNIHFLMSPPTTYNTHTAALKRWSFWAPEESLLGRMHETDAEKQKEISK
jgi:hypothetical protein